MWEQLERYKNQYLQNELKHMRSGTINQLQGQEMVPLQSQGIECNNSDGKCESTMYFKERAELAYGFWTLPKLMKEMGSCSRVKQSKAITSLGDYVMNHLHAQRAINEEDIVRRAGNIFLRLRYGFQKECLHEVMKLLRIFYYIGMHANGGRQILHNKRIVSQLYTMVKNREKEFMYRASEILNLIAKDAEDIYYLMDEYEALDKLANIYGKDICVPWYPKPLWLHLMALLELFPDKAMEKGFYEILFRRIKGRLLDFHIYDIRCFALLLRCTAGQERFNDTDDLKEIYEIFMEQKTGKRVLDTYEYVVMTIMNALMSSKILRRCCSFVDLPQIITKLAVTNSSNHNMQLLCFQTLRELGEMPSIKRYMRAHCLDDIKSIKAANEGNHKQLEELIYWLEREIYHTTNLRLYKRSQLPIDGS